MQEKFFITNAQYNSGFVFQEYNGAIKAVAAYQNREGEIIKKWMFTQGKDRKATDKTLPMQIEFGDNPEEVAELLREMLEMVEGRIGEKDGRLPPNVEKKVPKIDESEIPF